MLKQRIITAVHCMTLALSLSLTGMGHAQLFPPQGPAVQRPMGAQNGVRPMLHPTMTGQHFVPARVTRPVQPSVYATQPMAYGPAIVQPGPMLMQPSVGHPVASPQTAAAAPRMQAAQSMGPASQASISDVFQQTMAGMTSKAANDARVAALVAKAVQHEGAGQPMAAVTCYHQALELDATDFHTLMSFARLKHRIGDLDGAIVTYQTVLKLHPDNAMVLNDLALCKVRKGDPKSAAELLRAAVENKPSSKRYRNNLATVLIQLEDIQGAVDAITPTSGEAVARLFVAHVLRTKQPEESVHQLTEALRLDPTMIEARKLLAQIQLPERQLANQMLSVPGKVTAPVRSAQAPSNSNIRLQSGESTEDSVSRVFHADHYEIIESINE